jgi:hypothetical protein
MAALTPILGKPADTVFHATGRGKGVGSHKWVWGNNYQSNLLNVAKRNPALFMRVRNETAETPRETGARSREGGKHT